MTDPDVVRVGVIGTGFGASTVAPAFDATDGCTVVDVVTPRDDAAVAALCARDDVDVISVHSPPFLHVEHVRRAVEAGHAVHCDKPFGRNADESAQMTEPFRANLITKISGEMPLHPNVPWRNDQAENREILPS